MTRGNDSTSPILDKAGRDNDGVTHFANVPFSGLTKRELFAAMAMQGLVTMFQTNMSCEDHIAMLAVEQADALIEALNEGSGKV